MEQTTTSGTESWAEESANWTESIGDNTVQESHASAGDDPTTLFKEPAAPSELNEAVYDLALPDGIEADSELLQEFAGVAKESGLPPQAARKILDLQVKNAQRQMDAFASQQSAWRNEISNDPAFGGARLGSTVSDAQRALKAYDPDGTLLPELNRTGYGNHPGIIRFLARVGRTVKEDTAFSERGGNSGDSVPLRDRLWPD